MSVETSKIANVRSQPDPNMSDFIQLKLWIAVATHNFKWMKIVLALEGLKMIDYLI